MALVPGKISQAMAVFVCPHFRELSRMLLQPKARHYIAQQRQLCYCCINARPANNDSNAVITFFSTQRAPTLVGHNVRQQAA